MTIHALISWYEESPAWLAATTASLTKAGITSIIAIDGAYGLYPDGQARSGTEQAQALTETCHALNLALTIHAPQHKWAGNETEKRTALFRLADSIATPHTDWYFVMDADQTITNCHTHLPTTLANTTKNCGTVTFWERTNPHNNPTEEQAAQQFPIPETNTTQVRCIFRAIPGITVQGNHFTYVTPNKQRLWGAPHTNLEPALDLTDTIHIEHRNKHRSKQRTNNRLEYYRRRDTQRIELGKCDECGTQATSYTTAYPEPHTNGVAIGTIEICDTCKPTVTERTKRQIKELGYDPDTLVPTGKAIAA